MQEKIIKLLSKTVEDIEEILKDEKLSEKDQLMGLYYKTILETSIAFKEEVNAKVEYIYESDKKNIEYGYEKGEINNLTRTGKIIKAEEDLRRTSLRTGKIVTDIVEVDEIISTKTGNRICLSEEPSKLVMKTGKIIELDEDLLKHRTGNKFESDEELFMLKTNTGKKIVLDKEPVVIYSKTGKRINLEEDPMTQRTGNIITLDEDPYIVEFKTGVKLQLAECPYEAHFKTGKIIESDEDLKMKKFHTGKKLEELEDPVEITLGLE